MRFIKMFGLAAIAAVAAMAFVATSASATSTQLCLSHDALTCDAGEAATSQGVLGSSIISGNPVSVLCLHFLMSGSPLALANPQQIHVTSHPFTGCGTKSEHNNCEVLALELPLADLLKTGLDTGTLTFLNGRIHFLCDNVDIFGIDLACDYDTTGLTFSVGAQHLTAFETPISEIGSDMLCPDNPTLNGLLKTTANRYILA